MDGLFFGCKIETYRAYEFFGGQFPVGNFTYQWIGKFGHLSPPFYL
jgi:hypothetical protein